MPFVQATKKQSRLRLALIGPSGSGKTFSSLAIAAGLLSPKGKIAVIDSEKGSASKYADKFPFDRLELESFSPELYVRAIHEAEEAGYEVLIIDSLSHAWMGKDGALEQVDKYAARSQSRNSFGAWREVTPMHNALIDAMIQSRCHIIATMRTKTEWVIEENERGKKAPRKIGMAPVQRDGMEYEFDVVGDLDLDNTFIVSKTRCSELTGQVIKKPGAQLGKLLAKWLGAGTAALAPATSTSTEKMAPAPAPSSAPKAGLGSKIAGWFGGKKEEKPAVSTTPEQGAALETALAAAVQPAREPGSDDGEQVLTAGDAFVKRISTYTSAEALRAQLAPEIAEWAKTVPRDEAQRVKDHYNAHKAKLLGVSGAVGAVS